MAFMTKKMIPLQSKLKSCLFTLITSKLLLIQANVFHEDQFLNLTDQNLITKIIKLKNKK